MRLAAILRRASAPLLLCLFAHLAFGPSRAWARSEEEIRTAIEETLLQRHPTDTLEWWRTLGPMAPKVIISVYESKSHIAHRIKLLQGLSAFDTSESVEFLKKQAQAASDDVIRTTSVKGVGVAAGARESEFLSKYLHHEDPQTRLTAAQALAAAAAQGDARARSMLEQFRREEKNSMVLARLANQLPGPTAVLKPVSTSEDQLSPELAGEWTGLWIKPQKKARKGVLAEELVLRLRREGANDLKGDVLLSSPRTGRTWLGTIEQVTGKASAFAGAFILKAQGQDPRVELPFEAQLHNEGDSLMLVVHVRRLGVWAILKKSP